MKLADILAELEAYTRERREDRGVVERFEALLETPAPLSRTQYLPGHLTCSACVIDAAGTRVLLLRHTKLRRWLQPGGHVEPGDASTQAAARREVAEECGIDDLELLRGPDGGALVDVDVHEIPERKGEPAHLHYDLRYAFTTRAGCKPVANEESAALRWIDAPELNTLTDEWSVTRLVARTLTRSGETR